MNSAMAMSAAQTAGPVTSSGTHSVLYPEGWSPAGPDNVRE